MSNTPLTLAQATAAAIDKGPKPHNRTAARRRAKEFGIGRPTPMDRNAKARLMHQARATYRNPEHRKSSNPITRTGLDIFRTLLYEFHNAASGFCFPKYESIAEAASCARSTVAAAITALEDAGLLTWINRLVRKREPCTDLLGNNATRTRVVRTSNSYTFGKPPQSSKSENRTGTANQVSPLPLFRPQSASPERSPDIDGALKRLGEGVRRKFSG